MDYPKFIVSVQKEKSVSIQMVKTPEHHVGISILKLQTLDSQERLNILGPDTAPMTLEDFSKISLFSKWRLGLSMVPKSAIIPSVCLLLFFCLFDLILYVHSTILQLCGTGLPGLNQC